MTQAKVDPNTAQAATSIRRGVTQLARHLRRLRGAPSLSAAKLALLGHLYRSGGPLTANDLARLESLQPQSLTRLIADLEQEGLILRQRAQADRRQIEIKITQSGEALLIANARRQDAWLGHAMTRSLTETEIEILRLAGQLLARLSGPSAFDHAQAPDIGPDQAQS